ncbi:MAG: hypothetical protein KTR22_00355 [Flavobacteriaceae bacterium]|nr:hypothetical protein [Flavobacteriaceae bacterium]
MDLKALSHNVISFLVVLSLLVPSVAPFLECDSELIISMEISDDESKKEHKKELDEKEVFFQELTNNDSFDDHPTVKLFGHYLESHFQVDQEIFLPPPEHTI